MIALDKIDKKEIIKKYFEYIQILIQTNRRALAKHIAQKFITQNNEEKKENTKFTLVTGLHDPDFIMIYENILNHEETKKYI